MQPLSKEQKIELLSRLYWDSYVSPEMVYNYLFDKADAQSITFDPVNLYRRMLTTLDWYTILKLVPFEKLDALLHEDVIQRLYPKSLQKKFRYVRSVLSEPEPVLSG